jgi:hypothetical protein
MNLRLFTGAVSTGTVLLLIGCSGHLSRSKAQSEIEREINVGMPGYTGREMLVQVGRIAKGCFGQSDYDPVANSDEYKAIASTGFVTVTPEKQGGWSITLTGNGKQAVKDHPYAHKINGFCDYSQVTLPLSTFDHLEVDGILEDGPHAKADVTFTWKVTALGKALKTEVTRLGLSRLDSRVLIGEDMTDMEPGAATYQKYESVIFDKYDDGWKIRY